MTAQRSTEDLLGKAGRFLIPTTMGDRIIVSGSGVYVEDAEGRRYIDCMSGPGVAGLGHGHPAIQEAIVSQAGRLVQAPGGHLTREAILLAEKLATIAPAHMPRSYFVNSGAEAVDLSVKLASKHQYSRGRSGLGLIALQYGFHGRSALALTLSGLGSFKKGLAGYASVPGVTHIASPYCYRCPFQPTGGGCCDRPIHDLEDTARVRGSGDLSAIVLEPILGVGGVIVPPPDFLPKVEEFCRREGILLIVDEIFTGFGRTGTMFAHQHWGVKPDLMALGKYLGGGLPLAAAVATDAVASTFESGDHYTTFGVNNALTCAVALTAITVLEDLDLPSRAATVGTRLLGGLHEAARDSSIIGEVRGLGLLIGAEVVWDRSTKKPSPELASMLRGHLLDRGVLVSITSELRNCIRFTPPLTLTAPEADVISAAFADSLRAIEREPGPPAS